MPSEASIPHNPYLTLAGVLSSGAAILHLAIIVGGPDWYRFFGAGEQMAMLAEQGSSYPAKITLAIAAVLALWALYALSGAGVIRRLSLLRWALVLITTIYLVRGLGGLLVALMPTLLQQTQLSFSFMLCSSLICSGYGIAHLVGVYRNWRYL